MDEAVEIYESEIQVLVPSQVVLAGDLFEISLTEGLVFRHRYFPVYFRKKPEDGESQRLRVWKNPDGGYFWGVFETHGGPDNGFVPAMSMMKNVMGLQNILRMGAAPWMFVDLAREGTGLYIGPLQIG